VENERRLSRRGIEAERVEPEGKNQRGLSGSGKNLEQKIST